MSLSTGPVAPLTAENEDELGALVRLIEHADSFVLAFARVNDPAVAERVAARLGERLGRPLAVVTADRSRPLAEQLVALEVGEAAGVVVLDLDAVVDVGDDHLIDVRALNLTRDRLGDHFKCPLVLVG